MQETDLVQVTRFLSNSTKGFDEPDLPCYFVPADVNYNPINPKHYKKLLQNTYGIRVIPYNNPRTLNTLYKKKILKDKPKVKSNTLDEILRITTLVIFYPFQLLVRPFFNPKYNYKKDFPKPEYDNNIKKNHIYARVKVKEVQEFNKRLQAQRPQLKYHSWKDRFHYPIHNGEWTVNKKYLLVQSRKPLWNLAKSQSKVYLPIIIFLLDRQKSIDNFIPQEQILNFLNNILESNMSPQKLKETIKRMNIQLRSRKSVYMIRTRFGTFAISRIRKRA